MCPVLWSVRDTAGGGSLSVDFWRPLVTEESCFGWVPDFKEFSNDLEKLEYILKKSDG